MGLIKAAKEAIGSTLGDQWKEAIRCENMTNDILMMRRTTESGVISNGSTIVVEPGQCAIIVDNGRVIDATAEDGMYILDTSSTPSFFAGQFGETFKEMWQRFTYNGVSSKQQEVYFFNIKEILENRFGTAIPIPFQDWSHPLMNEMTNTMSPLRLEIKCFGKYTFRIIDPALFMTRISGTNEEYKKDELVEDMKSEIIAILQNIINELGNEEHKVPVLELPSQTDEIRKIIDERECDKNIRARGIEILSFMIESVTLTDESEQKIDHYEYSTNAQLQKTRMVDAYANAIERAAENSQGVLNGMMGIGIMNMTTDGSIKDVAEKAFGHKQESNILENKWECPNCKEKVEGEFCSKCGTKKTEQRFCTNCGTKVENDAKFCSNCGNKI